MSVSHECAFTSAHRKRGAAKASLKRLDGSVTDMEARGVLTIDDRLCSQQMLQKLNSVESNFKAHITLRSWTFSTKKHWKVNS